MLGSVTWGKLMRFERSIELCT